MDLFTPIKLTKQWVKDKTKKKHVTFNIFSGRRNIKRCNILLLSVGRVKYWERMKPSGCTVATPNSTFSVKDIWWWERNTFCNFCKRTNTKKKEVAFCCYYLRVRWWEVSQWWYQIQLALLNDWMCRYNAYLLTIIRSMDYKTHTTCRNCCVHWSSMHNFLRLNMEIKIEYGQ